VIDDALAAAASGQTADPAALLEQAWRLEPIAQYTERRQALDRLSGVLDSGQALPIAPAGRHWRCELWAERAIDAGRERRLDEARALVAAVVSEAAPEHRTALGRAMLAEGQALAWIGTDDATRRARRAFAAAVEHFEAIGHRNWQGSALIRWGYSACYQHGDLVAAEELIRRAVEIYEPDRLSMGLGFYADVLIDLGEFERAEEALERSDRLTREAGDERAEIPWARARIATYRGDATSTQTLLAEAERIARGKDWWETHIGASFLLDCAEQLDLLGLTDEAQRMLARARAHPGAEDDEVVHTAAVLSARSGDPLVALEQLQGVARGDWLEKRTIWRHTLLTAWATLRAGGGEAGAIAARALEQADGCGGMRVARTGEPELVRALAPLAEAAGSSLARELLLEGRPFLARVRHAVGGAGRRLGGPAAGGYAGRTGAAAGAARARAARGLGPRGVLRRRRSRPGPASPAPTAVARACRRG
jgi:tetratricopeptide (TPR) repeat protein